MFNETMDEVHDRALRWNEARDSWMAAGWLVHESECPECGQLVVKRPGVGPEGKAQSRWTCTAYGQCELSVG